MVFEIAPEKFLGSPSWSTVTHKEAKRDYVIMPFLCLIIPSLNSAWQLVDN